MGNKWISVEEKLPKHFQEVMFYVDPYEEGPSEGYYIGYLDSEDLCFRVRMYVPKIDSYWEEIKDRVTHWQPLPPPPNTNNNGH
jgi:hypothetical protein